MTLKDIDYNKPFSIPEGDFSKSGVSVNIDQKPDNPIGTGPVFYQCFLVDRAGKRKQSFRWICSTTEVGEFKLPQNP